MGRPLHCHGGPLARLAVFRSNWWPCGPSWRSFAEFGTLVTNVQTLGQSQAFDSTGLAADKEQLHKAMALAAVEIAGATNAYTKKVKNNDLAAKSNVSVTDITSGRDTVAATTARNIHALATANVANLMSYGVTAAKLATLLAKIDDYAADAVLNDQMDALVPQSIPPIPHLSPTTIAPASSCVPAAAAARSPRHPQKLPAHYETMRPLETKAAFFAGRRTDAEQCRVATFNCETFGPP